VIAPVLRPAGQVDQEAVEAVAGLELGSTRANVRLSNQIRTPARSRGESRAERQLAHHRRPIHRLVPHRRPHAFA